MGEATRVRVGGLSRGRADVSSGGANCVAVDARAALLDALIHEPLHGHKEDALKRHREAMHRSCPVDELVMVPVRRAVCRSPVLHVDVCLAKKLAKAQLQVAIVCAAAAQRARAIVTPPALVHLALGKSYH